MGRRRVDDLSRAYLVVLSTRRKTLIVSAEGCQVTPCSRWLASRTEEICFLFRNVRTRHALVAFGLGLPVPPVRIDVFGGRRLRPFGTA